MKLRSIYLFILLFALNCEDTVPIRDNPLDDEGGDYISPTISLLDIVDGDTLYSESVEFTLEGNELVADFRYKLDSFDWTDWNESNTTTLSYLDEGNRQLSVQSRYLNGDTSDVASVSFVVDAVGGPSLMFYPRRHFAQAGETVTFQIKAEEVTNLMMSEIHLEYDPTMLEIMSISQGSFFQNGQNSIFLYETNSEAGAVQINTTLLDGDSPSVSGTGDLAEIQVKLLQSGSATVNFNGSDAFIDPENNDITILEKINGLVVTE
tara:strand:- start:45 stop:836 length:792 start_codon:yes stop_codon:yes gene_type:complete